MKIMWTLLLALAIGSTVGAQPPAPMAEAAPPVKDYVKVMEVTLTKGETGKETKNKLTI